jgi:Predicted ATP-dependent serine protease
VLEHLVDVVLSFEGDKHSTLRMVRGVKNRFGPADEVGCFELRDTGIVGMPDPSGLFLARFGGPPVPGTAVTVVLDGRRPLPAELQALVTGKDIPSPRRAVSGLDNARVAMLLAVLETRAGCGCTTRRSTPPPSAGCASSSRPPTSRSRWPSPRPAATSRRPTSWCSARSGWQARSAVSQGWIGGSPRRARLGFTHALVPPGSGPGPAGMKITEVRDVWGVLNAIR